MLKSKTVNLTVSILFLVIITILDYAMPIGLSLGVLYICCIMLVFNHTIQVIIGIGIACTVLTLLKILLFIGEEISMFYYSGRAVSLLAIWLTVLAIRNYKLLTLKLNNNIALLESKNKEMEQFVYIASHDLQEPLRTVMSFNEALREDYHGKLDEEADRYLHFMHKGLTRMQSLVKGLLDYSRIGREPAITTVDCNEVLEEVMADMSGLIANNNALVIADTLPTVKANQMEIKQLFQNLISNAIKFSNHSAQPQIKITVTANSRHWQFAFTDNGIGIDEKDFEKIFVIFKKIHHADVYEGTGIGLAHCKKIVEVLGGRIWVTSALGIGSTFYFTIPK
jgi:light-regulated signal transduction histidine kinase (bacteriophytochrome)